MVAIRADERLVCQRYLFAVLRSAMTRRAIEDLQVGTMIPHFKKGDFDKLMLPIPSRSAQEAIGDLHFELCERIDTLHQTNTTLEAIAQALFKSWFVDFDPVRAKAEGREPEATDPATAALFPNEFEESELGLIPKGWHAGIVGEVSHLNARSWSSKRHPDTVTYVDLSGVHENRIGVVNELPFSEAPSRARRSLQDGDTIVGTVRPGNRAFAYVHRPATNLTGSTGFAVLSPKDETWAPFVYLAATRKGSIKRLANLADGGAYPAVRPDVVSATPATIPHAEIIAAFSAITSPILCEIGENRDAEATLVELRDTLLPRLISGKLRLAEAHQLAESEA